MSISDGLRSLVLLEERVVGEGSAKLRRWGGRGWWGDSEAWD